MKEAGNGHGAAIPDWTWLTSEGLEESANPLHPHSGPGGGWAMCLLQALVSLSVGWAGDSLSYGLMWGLEATLPL